jgi:hypothetical protein
MTDPTPLEALEEAIKALKKVYDERFLAGDSVNEVLDCIEAIEANKHAMAAGPEYKEALQDLIDETQCECDRVSGGCICPRCEAIQTRDRILAAAQPPKPSADKE